LRYWFFPQSFPLNKTNSSGVSYEKFQGVNLWIIYTMQDQDKVKKLKAFFPSLAQAPQNSTTQPETPKELAEEANKLEADLPPPPPPGKNGKILANLLKESEDI
jgi:hypothetical protein